MKLTIYGRLYVQSASRTLKYLYFALTLAFLFIMCRAIFSSATAKTSILSAVILILILSPQRPIKEGGLVRNIAEQGLFIRYQTTEIVLFFVSLGILFVFLLSKNNAKLIF